jgi:hypothetical protein
LATYYHTPGDGRGGSLDVVPLLLERGARHHIFSAIVVGDLNLIQMLVEQNPEALDCRMSLFEQRQTALHFAMNRGRYDILDLLIDLGADLEAEDGNGHTALVAAMLKGDREAMSRLHAAGAKQPKQAEASSFQARMAEMALSIRHSAPMIRVPNIAETLDWYKSIGFKEVARNEEDGVLNWGMLSFGRADLMVSMDGKAARKT